MSYSAVDQLTQDSLFGGRVRACAVEQALVFQNDARPEFVALADAVLKNEPEAVSTITRLVASAPGLADKASTGDGLDQTQITDGDILSSVQAQWPTVAELLYGT
jgi:hypothetical protein